MRGVQNRSWRVRLAAAAAVVTLGAVPVGCGGDDDEPTGETSGSAPVEDAAGAAQKRVELWYEGPTGSPPTTGPEAEPGKNIWAITYGLNSTAGAEAVRGAEEAGEALGWDVTGFDGKFSSATYLAGIRNAIDAGADGIYLYAIDCATVTSGLKEAKEQGIPVVAAESYDCDQTTDGAEPLYTGQLRYDDQLSDPRFYAFDDYEKTDLYPSLAYAMGAAQADWLIATLGSEAKVIQMTEIANQADADIALGFEKQFTAACPTCEIVQNVEYQPTEYGPGLQQKTQQALLAHPETKGIFGHYDAPVTSGIAAGVRAAGRIDDVHVTGGEGDPPNVTLVREENGQSMGSGYSVAWESWAAMDALNRIFNDAPIENSGIGVFIWDKDHNMPETDTFVPTTADYQAAYREAWGVE